MNPDERTMRELLQSLDPSALSEERVDSIYRRIATRIREHEAGRQGVTTVRASHDAWRPLLPGVEMKVLFDDGTSTTWLARMNEGATLPAHDHPGDEEFMILEGRVRLGELELAAGDYQHVPRGTRHEHCVALLRTVALLRSPSAMCVFAGKGA
ncbi:hypothetical protein BWI17_21275 [Betaproteobacteria bacterium GR16-43]|nr:hypothetical protein BWI17_21275 [Betaproteobacteria bacterium GR16-43]